MHRHEVRNDRLLKWIAPDRLTPSSALAGSKILKDLGNLGPAGSVLGDEGAISSLYPCDLQIGANEADPHDLRRCCEGGSESRFKRSGIFYVELPLLD
jgi:hypothetical protein